MPSSSCLPPALLLLPLLLLTGGCVPAHSFGWSPHNPQPVPPHSEPKVKLFPGYFPHFRIRPVDKVVTAGEKFVDFYCKAAAPTHYGVEWNIMSPEGEIIIGDHHEVSPDGGRLRIYQPMDFYDGFQVCCILHSAFTKPVKALARLRVNSPTRPRLVVRPRSGKYCQGSRVALECAARGLPVPKIVWMFRPAHTKRKTFFGKDQEYKFHTKEPNRLIITNLGRGQSGTYFCIAYNPKGYVRYRAEVRFARCSLRTRHMQRMRASVAASYRKVRRLSHSARRRNHRRATCNMEISNQFLYTDRAVRHMDTLTMVFDDAVKSVPRLGAHSPKPKPGEVLNIDLKYLDFIRKGLNCSGDTLPQTDCGKYSKFLSKYRSFDGSCNNWRQPAWGKANSPFARFLAPQYEDGLLLPQGYSKNVRYGGFKKPSARLVTLKAVLRNDFELDYAISQEHNNFGQILDHDIDLTPNSATNRGIHRNTDCNQHCHNDLPCFPIPVPHFDPRVKGCLSFKRSAAFCSTGADSSRDKGFRPREQVNGITSFLDASFVYGSNCRVAQELRELNSPYGFLKTSPPPKGKKLRMLPLGLSVPTACANHADAPGTPCYGAGDARSNEFVGILTIHTMFVREHNRIGYELHRLNPHWCSEKIYLEAKKIVGAVMQQITYNEYLTVLLGESGMNKYIGKYKGYNPEANPSTTNQFASASFRFQHAFIPDKFYSLDAKYRHTAHSNQRLESGLLAPHVVAQNGIDEAIRASLTVAMKAEHKGAAFYGDAVCNRLFERTSKVAGDLGALDIQRGRDHGLPGYNYWRVFCGLQWAASWKDLRAEITDPVLLKNLKKVYGSPENIDLMMGMLAEDRIDDSLLGPTAQCLIGKQFRLLRDGDRHWFENPGEFTRAQKQELKRYTYSRLVCNTVESINHIQRQSFFIPRQKSDLVPCRFIADMDLMAWKDPDSRRKKCVPRSPCSDEIKRQQQQQQQQQHRPRPRSREPESRKGGEAYRHRRQRED